MQQSLVQNCTYWLCLIGILPLTF